MANDLDSEIYVKNDDLIVCRPEINQVNGTSGLVEASSLTGRTDGVAFISTSGDARTATAFGGLTKNLTEGPAGVYSAVLEGSDKATAFTASVDGTVFYRHYKFGDDYHTVASVIFRNQRVIV